MDDTELYALQAGEWQIDSPKIKIQDLGTGKNIFQGPGIISQNDKGKFKLKFFSESSNKDFGFQRINRLKPGKLIPNSEYFNLCVQDMKGQEWRCDRIYPDFSSSSTALISIITADIDELYIKKRISGNLNSSSVTMRFNQKFKFPKNESTALTKERSGKIIGGKNALDTWIFDIGIYNVTISVADELINIFIGSPRKRIPKNIYIHFCESLSFVFGLRLDWFYLERIDNGIITTNIRPPISYSKIEQISPIPIRLMEKNKDASQLLEMYFNFIELQSKKGKTTISREVAAIHDSLGASLEAQLLTISIAIESIINSLYITTKKHSEYNKSDIESIKKAIKKLNIDENISNRIFSFLGYINSPTVTNVIRDLVSNRLIRKSLFDSWKAIRNKAAHGRLRIENSKEAANYIKKYYSTLTLFNCLIFLSIGYKGEYVDYGTFGWPIKNYNKLYKYPL